jgi:L-arabinonolactonase
VRSTVRIAAASRNVLGEGPLWCPKEQVLWWIDVHDASLWRLDVATDAVESRPFAKPPVAIALIEEGGLR